MIGGPLHEEAEGGAQEGKIGHHGPGDKCRIGHIPHAGTVATWQDFAIPAQWSCPGEEFCNCSPSDGYAAPAAIFWASESLPARYCTDSHAQPSCAEDAARSAG